MGCNSSSAIPLGESESTVGRTEIKVRVNPCTPETVKLGSVNGVPEGSFPRRTSTPPLTGMEPPMEALKDFNTSTDSETKTEFPPLLPLAFDVPINEGSIIKKHPPKKFRLLPEQVENSRTLTREKLNSKLQEAEMRRKQILNQRIQSAHQKNVQYQQLLHSEAIKQKSEEAMAVEKNMW